jgi:Protein of unknown function (DUF2817)
MTHKKGIEEKTVTSSYSETYAEARKKFLDLAAKRGVKVTSIVHPTQRGAQGEELAIDIGIFGDPKAERTFFQISGTHGQEGFYGSAMQIEFLRNLDIPDGMNVIALHALNPWGFSYLSRTDETNVDINRNFTDYGVAFDQDELYPSLFKALCPDDWTKETIDWSAARDAIVRDYGVKRMVTAAGGGQIVEPTGMNYVGTGPSWSRSVVESQLPGIFRNARKIAFIEWHTGLGGYAELSHIPMMTPESAGYKRMFSWLDEEARSSWSRGMDFTNGVTPNYRGWFSAWLPNTAPHAEWAGMVIEAGTYGVIEVMDGIRMDRWLKFGKGHSYLPREEMRRSMMDKLYPEDPSWRQKSLANGLDTQKRFVSGLMDW